MPMFSNDSRQFKFDVLREISTEAFKGDLDEAEIQARARNMVGPPSHREDDEKVVQRLLSATGRKVCCGGTTSEIVARACSKELTTELDLTLMADVPPKGYIDGIDLVTEGVLTLQKVSRYLAKAAGDTQYAESLLASHGAADLRLL